MYPNVLVRLGGKKCCVSSVVLTVVKAQRPLKILLLLHPLRCPSRVLVSHNTQVPTFTHDVNKEQRIVCAVVHGLKLRVTVGVAKI